MNECIGRSVRIHAVFALFLLAGVLAAPHNAAAAPPAATVVDIDKFAFAPKEITVKPGTKVVWANHDQTPHTVSGGDKSFASKGLDTDDKYEHTFTSEGDFPYTCTLHPYMTGVVHVRSH